MKAASENEIIDLLRDVELEPIADRLVYLQECVADDPEEEPMDLESLKQFASFIMSERQLRQPRIGVNPDGFIQAEWELTTDGGIAMNFLPSGFIEFAAISAPATHKVQRIRVSGTLAKDNALRDLAPFFSRLTTRQNNHIPLSLDGRGIKGEGDSKKNPTLCHSEQSEESKISDHITPAPSYWL